VIHACGKIEGLLATDRELRATIEDLTAALTG
jgi:chromosomal replication initiation ATPase DnaA